MDSRPSQARHRAGATGADPRGTVSPVRRALLGAALAAAASPWHRASAAAHSSGAIAVTPAAASAASKAVSATALPVLDREQSQRFRDWMTLLIHAQLENGPTPRWTHRDCAGLVRFAVAEALRSHDADWKRANGLAATRVPPDLDPAVAQGLRNAWRRVDGSRDAYVGALELVQENTRFVARQLNQAQAGDLLFYDQGDDQHLMVWMGRYVAYHTGHVEPGDNGLRALRPEQLFGWQDTRWRPTEDNPNFSGVYQLAFLAR